MGRGTSATAGANVLAQPVAQSVTRVIASTTLWFSSIPIQVKVYPSATKKYDEFHWLSPSGNPIKLRYEDAQTQERIQFKELQRGVQVGKTLLPLSEQEWAQVAGEKKNLIETREPSPNGN
jgi:non-homologous end joining protein Ku